MANTKHQILTASFVLISAVQVISQGLHNFSVTGLDADNEGIFAYNNSNGGTGHNIPTPYDAFGNEVAYYYLATREIGNYDPIATTGMHGTGAFTNFPSLAAALNAAGKSFANINCKVDGLNLGNDVRGTDWDLIGDTENRIYQGGIFAILLDSDTLVVGNFNTSHLIIDYNDSKTPFDDSMTGHTEHVTPVIAAAGTTNVAIANALMNDVGNYGLRINFASVQPSGQTEYSSGAITGGFFEIQQATIETGVMTIPNLGTGLTACQGDSIQLDAGAGKSKYLWSTGDTTQTIWVKNSGNYFVTVDSASYRARSASADVSISTCTSADEIGSTLLLNCYPNPVNEVLNVSLGNATLTSVELMNNVGQTVKSMTNLYSTTAQISVKDLESGIYFLVAISSSGGRVGQSIVIE